MKPSHPEPTSSCNLTCLVCGDFAQAEVLVATERLFGLGGEYSYGRCPACHSLQLLNAPSDLASFYPPGYYSFAPKNASMTSSLGNFIKRCRARSVVEGKSFFGGAVRRFLSDPPRLLWMKELGLGLDASILDVGCGGGELLLKLQQDGFRNLTGVDPFLDSTIDYGGGLVIHKRNLAEMEGTWDLVMLHHSLEHMPDPHAVFEMLQSRIKPGGKLLIRVPVADCAAWNTYGVLWVQLDAPRHLVLFSRQGLINLASAFGFVSSGVHDDSTAFQFWGSELYRRDLPLREEGRQPPGWKGRFELAEMKQWGIEADRLNAEGAGDQTVFFFAKTGPLR
jgi:SAM-dependent methyltransferase